MRLTQIAAEAWRNVASGAARAGSLALIVILLATGLLAVDILTIGRLDHGANRFRAQGGSLRVLVAENAIAAPACDRLTELDGVAGAGALQVLPSTNLVALGGQEVQVYGVSPGGARILGMPAVPGAGIYLSRSLAARWSVAPGDTLQTTNGPSSVLGVFDYSEADGRDPRLAAAIVVGLPPDAVASECWVDVWPMTRDLDHLIYLALTPSSEAAAEPQIVPANPSLGEQLSPNSDFHARKQACGAGPCAGLRSGWRRGRPTAEAGVREQPSRRCLPTHGGTHRRGGGGDLVRICGSRGHGRGVLDGPRKRGGRSRCLGGRLQQTSRAGCPRGGVRLRSGGSHLPGGSTL